MQNLPLQKNGRRTVDDMKCISYSVDQGYSFKLKATDNGAMDYVIAKSNAGGEGHEDIKLYQNIKLETGKEIKAANPLKIKVKAKTYKQKSLTKVASFNIGTTNAKGTVKYTPDTKAKNAGITVTAKGKVVIPKKCKADRYKITVRAAGGTNYKAGTRTVTIVVKAK